MFVGAPVATGPGARDDERRRETVRRSAARPDRGELARQLMEEGIVIRGHDIARVVGLMAGVDVEWDDRRADP